MAGKGPRRRAGLEYESPLHEYRIAKGLTGQRLSELADVQIHWIWGFAIGTVAPLYTVGPASGRVKPEAERVAEVLGVTIEDLFPRYFCKIEQQLGEGLPQDLSVSEYTLRSSAGSGCEDNQARTVMDAQVELALSSLPPREEQVLRERYWAGMTLEALSKKYGRTRERFRQIEARALRRLRHPSRRVLLKADGLYPSCTTYLDPADRSPNQHP